MLNCHSTQFKIEFIKMSGWLMIHLKLLASSCLQRGTDHYKTNKYQSNKNTKIPLPTFSFPSSTFSISVHTSLHTNSLHTSSFTYFLPTAFAPSLLPSIYITILPSDPTFLLSSAMLLAHFHPFTEVLSCQLHFSLYLSKYTKI